MKLVQTASKTARDAEVQKLKDMYHLTTSASVEKMLKSLGIGARAATHLSVDHIQKIKTLLSQVQGAAESEDLLK